MSVLPGLQQHGHTILPKKVVQLFPSDGPDDGLESDQLLIVTNVFQPIGGSGDGIFRGKDDRVLRYVEVSSASVAEEVPAH